jgi:hypothetical protein
MTPRMLLRGLLKFVAVVVAAGVVGAGLGIALAELSGNDDAGTAIAPPATSTAGRDTTTAVGTTTTSARTPTSRTTGTTRTTGTPTAARNRTTRVQIQ